MAKLTLSPIGSFSQSAITTINQNMDDIETALEKTLSRDGTTPNQMTADLDLNGNDVLNVDNLDISGSLTIGGEVVIPDDITAGTAAEILTAIKTVDGSGSGLDADMVDGLHASAFLPGLRTSDYAGADESARIAAMFAANPTQPYAYKSDTHFGIIRETFPLNYQGTEALLVTQKRHTTDLGAQVAVPSVVFQQIIDADGVVTAASDISETIWSGVFSATTKTGDGSAHTYTGTGELHEVGPGGYNELGLFQGEATNISSTRGSISGLEVLIKDGTSGVSNFDTRMYGAASRLNRRNAGIRRSDNFVAASEGTQPVNSAFTINQVAGASPGGYQRYIDFSLAPAPITGQAILLPNNTSLAWQDSGGTGRPTVFLSGTNEVYIAAATTTGRVSFGNSDFEKQFSILSVDNAVNNVVVSGGTTGNSPTLSVEGETNVGLTVSTKGTGNLVVNTNSTEAIRIDSSQAVLKGTTTARTIGNSNATTAAVQVHGANNNGSAAEIARWTNDANPAQLFLFKSRGTAVGTRGIVSSGDALGWISFAGDDGTNGPTGAIVKAEVDATPGAGDMPGRLLFMTTSDGASSPSERLRIDSNGFATVTGSIGRGAPVTKTADFTVATTENWLINNKAAATCTVTLPAAASFTGREIMITNYQAFTVVSASSNVIPQVGGSASTAILAATAGKWATLVSNGTNWVIMQSN